MSFVSKYIIEVSSVSQVNQNSELLLGFAIDSPQPQTQVNGSCIIFQGWVLGTNSLPLTVEIIDEDGGLMEKIPVNQPRPDVAAVFPQVPSASHSGFWGEVVLTSILKSQQLQLQVVLEDGNRLTIGAIALERQEMELYPEGLKEIDSKPNGNYSDLNGFLDDIDGCLLRGWAWNAASPNEALTLIIYQDGDEIDRAIADRFRDDLKQAGIGTGNHGFCVRLPSRVCQAAPFDLKIMVEGYNWVLHNSEIRFEYKPIYEQSFKGNCEPITKQGKIKGWAVDKANLDKKLNIYVYEGNNFLLKVPANIYRKDMQKSFKGDGLYGYRFDIPEQLLDNKRHELHLCFENSAVELKKSPIAIDEGHALSMLMKNTQENLDKVVNLADELRKIY